MTTNRSPSIVGNVINFRGMIYAPTNEYGITILFGKVSDDLNIYIEEIKTGFPDCIARRHTKRGWERINIEFEFNSKNFALHKHDINECDVIVCWNNNWKDCPIEIIELKTIIKHLNNWQIKKQNILQNNHNTDIVRLLNKHNNPTTVAIAKTIIMRLLEIDEKIWIKPGENSLSAFCPERSFATIALAKTHVKISCFARGECFEGTRITNNKLSPRWCTFSLYDNNDIDFAIKTLTRSHQLIKQALANNEATHYLSQ